MKKTIVMLCILFSLTAPLKLALNYVIGLGNCIVEYGSEWTGLTIKTAKCAYEKATLQGGTNVIPN